MKKFISEKRNITVLAIIAFAIIAMVSVLMISRPAKAGGNNAGSADIATIAVSVDVNGKEAESGENDNAKADFESNNSKRLKIRYIYSSAVKEWLNDNSSGTSVFNGSGPINFKKDTIINSSKCITVDTTGSAALSTTIVLTAESITESGSFAYFSVELQRAVSGAVESHRAYFKVTVTDTFVPAANQTVYVGSTLTGNATAETEPSLDGAKIKPILDINNNSNVTVDLAQYLKDRALYTIDGSNNYNAKQANEKYWSIKSVTNFKIKSATFDVGGLSFQDQILGASIVNTNEPPIRISPSITGKIFVSTQKIKEYDDLHSLTPFWTATHYLTIVLEHITATNVADATIVIPVRFKPANPVLLTVSSSLLRLNVTSSAGFDIKSSEIVQNNAGEGGAAQESNNDYGAIYIRPSDLIEYSAPNTVYHYKGSSTMQFVHSDTRLNDGTDLKNQKGLKIERANKDTFEVAEPNSGAESYPEMYKITASKNDLANSNFKIKFNIQYFVGQDVDNDKRFISAEIAVTTYGGYSIKFAPIEGKKKVEYNINSSAVFAEMRERGYVLTGAKSLNEGQLGVTLSHGVLTLDPKVDNINGQATAKVMLEFINTERQVVKFESEIIDINVNAGSLFARFEDWQAWLIIAACILGGIIIILIIVWLFVRSLSKHKQDELAMQAPVSSYIVKLNSTIAATQAQQRMAQTQALSQASTMLLGAGPTGTMAPSPDTLQLATGIPSTPAAPAPSMSTPSAPLMSEPQATMPPTDGEENYNELIAKYITDDELLERIFTEKYEPKGMVRRTFFKSRDLQARELEKEKKRIVDRYKTPMPMDEAIMSETEVKNAGATSTPAAVSEPKPSEPKPTELFVLDFDPDSPLYVEPEKASDEFSEEKIDLDAAPEESKLKDTERRNKIIEMEIAELKSRLDKVQAEVEKSKSMETELRERIAKAEADDVQYGKDIEELEFKLASAKNKDKPIITRDIGIKEEKKKRNAEELERLRAELETLLSSADNIGGIYARLGDLREKKIAEQSAIATDLVKAKADYAGYVERLEQVRKRQELAQKVTGLVPMLEAVNNSDYEMRRLNKLAEDLTKERETLKATVASVKSQIMGATDFGVIADLNAQVSEANARLSDLEREITKTTKQKSDLQIEFNSQRRKANDFIEKNDIPLEEVIKADDSVLGAIEFEQVKARREAEKEDAEKAVATAQAVYDDLAASSNDVTMIAMEVASNIKDIEDEIELAKTELDAINAQMETAGEDERLMLMVDQGDKSDKLEALKLSLEQANVDGTKRKIEAQAEYDAKLEQARLSLDEANAEFGRACSSFDEFVNNTDPRDLISSGSGIISQDQKKFEAENFKKQLERSKNEIEQARLAAEQARIEAEEARRKAQEESEEARLEAERNAQAAIERAEQARLEAEERAKAEAEAAARAKQEAEETIAAEAEEAQRKAQEEAEAARKRAQEESEEVKRKAQEEIEEMRRKAQEEADAKRAEEESKRKEEEERQKAEAARNDAISKKVAVRKDQIIALRNEMRDLRNDEDAKNLRERLYNLQLSYDEDERGSSELMDFYNKTMDDIQNSGEIARLKAENAKKPQRVVRKVTERVNRIPKHKPGGARPSMGARPGGARPMGARPAGAGPRPAGARPPARPGGAGPRPAGARPPARPAGAPPRPAGARPPARPGGKPPVKRP